MNLTEWTPSLQRQLEDLAAAGKSASRAAEIMGTTRNAILGRAHRTGVKFNGVVDQLPRHVPARKERAPKRVASGWTPERRAAQGVDTKERWARGAMVRVVHPNRVHALAAFLAGVSAPKAARAFGCSPVSIWHNWQHDPGLIALAQPIADAAKADAIARKEAKRIAAEARKAVEKQRRDEHNAPILAKLSPRHALICGRILQGETLQQVGDALGITRERVRQIVALAMHRDGLDLGGRMSRIRPTKYYRQRITREGSRA